MTRRAAPMGLMACIALTCLTLLNQPYVYADSATDYIPEGAPLSVNGAPLNLLDDIKPGTPMQSVPIYLMPRSLNGRQKVVDKFRPKDSIQLRFVDAHDYNYAEYGACHHVDMDVQLKTETQKVEDQRPIPALNPFAFQNAVKSFSCSGSGANFQLNLELGAQYADQAHRWNMGSKTFAIVIPHDYVDLKKNQACFSALNAQAKKWTQTHPMETVVKLVKNPRFLNSKKPNVVTFSVVKTDIWSQMNREQSVHIAHREMDQIMPIYNRIHRRSTAEEKGPMWDFERDLSPATKTIAGRMNADNVKANLDNSKVKGYAQADMAWKQTCIKNIFTGSVHCLNWGISRAKISGLSEVNHSARVDIKEKRRGRSNAILAADPMLTLTRVNVTTPTFTIVAPMPLIGFSVPGVFDLGANLGITGNVMLNILVQATEDLLLNTGTASSCPWTVDWNGGLTSMPVIQFGTCTLPGTPKFLTNPGSAFKIKSNDNALYLGPSPEALETRRTNARNAILAAVPTAPSKGSRQTAYVRLGMNITPSLGLGLKIFGLNAVNAGVVAPLALGVNTNWDTQKTAQCPANNVALFVDGQASIALEGTFFGFSKTIAPIHSPALNSPAACIKV